MAERATISLDEESHTFLTEIAKGNKSAYINDLLKREKRRLLEEAVLKANQEEAEDTDYQEEVAYWDVTLTDGLE
ncbi:MAG: CopG family transcriptional regulator [Bacteroidota bacterium]